MHKSSFILLGLCAFFLKESAARAEDEGPCKAILESCRSAGYKLGEKAEAGKGLIRNCLVPILGGKSVENVVADPKDIAECKETQKKSGNFQALRDRFKNRKRKEEAPPPTPKTP